MGWSGYADDSVQAAQGLLARARAGDQAAARQLQAAASAGGWRPDHRNAAIDAYNELTPGTEGDLEHMKNPHGFLGDFGKGLGSVLKVAAPIAGMAIPGLGWLGGAALAGGGSALGGALHGDKFNPWKTLLAGGAGAAGQKLNLGQRIFGGGGMPNATPASSLSRAGATGTLQGAPGTEPDFLSKLGGFATQHPGDIAKAGLGLAGFLDARSQSKNAAQFGNEQLKLRQHQLDMAEQDYASRAPLRQSVMARLGSMASGPMGSSIYRRN